MSTLFRVLIDTCIWLDLAKSYRSAPLVHALREMCDNAELEIIVPDIVVNEFARNKERVLQESQKSLQTQVRLVKQAIPAFSEEEIGKAALLALDEIDFTTATGVAPTIVEEVEELMNHSENIKVETTIFHRARAASRALDKEAPCHRDKNSIADAILFEVYNELRSESVRDHISFGFATTNYRDFSDPKGDNRQPHPELCHAFSERSIFITDVAKFVEEKSPNLLNEIGALYDLAPDFRSLSELQAAEERFTEQIWYGRHMARKASIENGTMKVLAEAEYSRSPYRTDEILDSIWADALAAAKEIEKRHGLTNLGGMDDFEWGMINGKLSAIRWILGYEWDMLDT